MKKLKNSLDRRMAAYRRIFFYLRKSKKFSGGSLYLNHYDFRMMKAMREWRKICMGLLFIFILPSFSFASTLGLSFDLFNTGGVEESFNEDVREAVQILPGSSGDVKARGGSGLRLLFLKENKNLLLEYGLSVGYVKGPEIRQRLFYGGDTFTVNHKTEMICPMLHVGKLFPLGDSGFMKISLGAGYAQGEIKQQAAGTGVFSGMESHETGDLSGFTWEAGLSDVWTSSFLDFEVGVRYSVFPKGSFNSIPDFKWNPVSLYFSLLF